MIVQQMPNQMAPMPMLVPVFFKPRMTGLQKLAFVPGILTKQKFLPW